MVSTQGNGELPGESSLPFADFTSRLYIFHDDGLKGSQEPHIDPGIIDEVEQKAVASWAAQRVAQT